MASVDNVVKLDPPKELVFDFNKTEPETQVLKITNITNENVAFKVKTTAPKAYLVRPSNDVLKAGVSVEVQVLLQPPKLRGTYEQPHRFLVQVAPLPSGRDSNYTKEEWGKLGKGEMHEARLVVTEATANTLQEKYDKLVKYTVSLEKATLKLQTDRDDLQMKGKNRANEFQFELWHMILAMLLAVLLLNPPHMITSQFM